MWNPKGEIEVMLATNNYFLVVFLSITDRNKEFEGGPYFYNQLVLFIISWHVSFNPMEELPSSVLVWVQLP